MFVQTAALSALVAVVAAQSSSTCTQSATLTINSQADATKIASCDVIAGSIAIGSSPSGTIALDGPVEITGSLTSTNASILTGLTSTTIAKIGKEFSLTDMTVLSNLQFSVLTEVDSIDFEALPALSTLNFPESVSKCNSLKIVNTFLSSLDGINLMSADTILISDNGRLTTFSTQIGTVSTSIDIDNNGRSLSVEFPNLIWAANMTLRNVSSASIPSLSTVNGSLGFYGNYFESLSAPNLTTVGDFATGSGGITINDNSDMTNVTMPQLTSCGGLFQIFDDPKLGNISFPVLSKIGGALDFTGNFSTPDLPKLSNIKGAFNVQSGNQIDCTNFNKLEGNVVQGEYTCKTTATTTSTTGGSSGSGTDTGSGADPSSTKKGSATSTRVNAGLIGLSVVGGLVQMFL